MVVSMTIDGRLVWAEEQTALLDVAGQEGISIPTLCHHEALTPYGSCRLCVVEVVRHNRTRLVTSCNYPAQQGIEVRTASEPVRWARKLAAELLLARCPEAPEIRRLAAQMGVKTSRFKDKGDGRCILCGLCVRACDEIVGARAIGFLDRGTQREVNTPFRLESDTCIGCGACTCICPTTCIEMMDAPEGVRGRRMRMGDLALTPCAYELACETCEQDARFLEKAREVLKAVREG